MAKLREIALYFLKVGTLGFGGPFALIASFQKDLVENRKWISLEKFSQSFALIKALPGPTATLVAVYLGHCRAGVIGGLISGICLILPSFFMMLALASSYDSITSFEWTRPLLMGMQGAALGTIFYSAWKIAQPYARLIPFWTVVFLSALIAYQKPQFEPLLIISSGLLGLAFSFSSRKLFSINPVLLLLFFVFFKAGAFIFGSGLAIVPMLAHDVVNHYHWLNYEGFLDALAFGQITPGPVVITSTFIGYRVSGLLGAVIATVAVFLPGFLHILTWFPRLQERVKKFSRTKIFIRWALAAVVGSLLAALLKLSWDVAIRSAHAPLISFLALITFFLSYFTPFPIWLLIPGGGVIYSLLSPLF